ncbi:hypothetical protein BU24DRAFT_409500 [Aaosphaeria arxii CBS 175.79]|uniref:Uncharacterized protein n=1 Tax=Aaosphaeria arxii CBS 175.79 TaxID=1450172 RepID=A0A6A5XUB1_9PLEO|nr:uncharacterized protein BU24DRAFT_409500 [Aaosphaeria arxii CBS 175.79]KAF2016397.1 hypothetical protein BU24DRAFT_409500 [Aaosphaeria arxii CBS 175.79]
MSFIDSYWYHAAVVKKIIHAIQIFLIIGAFVCGMILWRDKSAPRGRMNMLILGYSIKSANLLAYILITSHVARFHRWASPKAYFIINVIEPIFWLSAFGMMCMRAPKCVGAKSCGTIGAALGLSFGLA